MCIAVVWWVCFSCFYSLVRAHIYSREKRFITCPPFEPFFERELYVTHALSSRDAKINYNGSDTLEFAVAVSKQV